MIAELVVHVLLDFLLQFRDVQLVRHLGLDGADALGNIEFLKNGLLFGGGQFQTTRDEIRELAAVIEIADQHADLFRHVLLVGQIAQSRIPESIHGSLPLWSVRVGGGVQNLHIGEHVWDRLGGGGELHALQHIDDEDGVVLAFLHLTQHLHRDADAIEVRHTRLFLRFAALREHSNGLVAPRAQHVVDQLLGRGAPNAQRQDHAWKEHAIANRQDGQVPGNEFLLGQIAGNFHRPGFGAPGFGVGDGFLGSVFHGVFLGGKWKKLRGDHPSRSHGSVQAAGAAARPSPA